MRVSIQKTFAVDQLQLDGPHETVIEIAVGDTDVDEATVRRSAELQCSCVARDPSSTHNNLATRIPRTLQADCVIAGIDIAIFNKYVVTAVEIEPVIVEVVVAKPDRHCVEMDVLTVDQMQSPECRPLPSESGEGHILTVLEAEQPRTSVFATGA